MAFDNSVEYASLWQLSLIESRLWKSSILHEEKEEIEKLLFDTSLTYDQADDILNYINNHYISDDPKDQFKQLNF